MIKDIIGYEGLYGIDEIGNVYSYKKNKVKILKAFLSKTGYYLVNLYKDKKIKSYSIHRLLAKAFIPEYSDNLCVDHIDRNKLNNCLSNLRMVTNQENLFNTNCKGYSWSKYHKKWQAMIRLNYKLKHLGYFNNPEDARKAYLIAKEKLHVIGSNHV